jgi:hypothetical protein
LFFICLRVSEEAIKLLFYPPKKKTVILSL